LLPSFLPSFPRLYFLISFFSCCKLHVLRGWTFFLSL
jgi:hypothetical protein